MEKSKVRFDDGSIYPAEMLVNDSGEVWNVRVFKEGGQVEEIKAEDFASRLHKNVDDVYLFTYELN